MAALYELTLVYAFAGQSMVNRWNYLLNGVPAAVSGSFALTSAAGALYDNIAIPPGYPSGTLVSSVADMLSVEAVLQEITVLNVYDPVDFYQTPFTQTYAGKRTGESASPLLAFGFRTNVVRRDIRRGMKRFGGLSENAGTTGGEVNHAAMDAYAQALIDVMNANLDYNDEGNTLTFAPCIVGKEKYVAPSGKNAYRYYGTFAEQADHLATGIQWQSYNHLRSQVSRQYGRGV